MATTKKTPTKKTTTRKAAPQIKAKQAPLQSFKVYKEPDSFTQFQITRQTIYWIILVSFIVFAQLWILKLQIEVATLLDAQQTELNIDSM